MNDLDRWLYLDGPEPELVRPVLDELADPEPTPEEEDRMVRGTMARIAARLASPSGGVSSGVSSPILLDDDEVESAPPTPPTPSAPSAPALALQKEEAPAPVPRIVRPPAFLAETAQSAVPMASIDPARAASGIRPAPTVRVAGAEEHARTLELPVMDPSLGARRPPVLSLLEYVTYRTELELWPAYGADFHRKYKVESEAMYQEVVRSWEHQIAALPHVRALAVSIRESCLEQARTMDRARSGGA